MTVLQPNKRKGSSGNPAAMLSINGTGDESDLLQITVAAAVLELLEKSKWTTEVWSEVINSVFMHITSNFATLKTSMRVRLEKN